LGWCRIFPVRNSTAMLTWYLTKYLSKMTFEWEDRWGIWTDERFPGTLMTEREE
jgi:hypothetical protein